jgi:tetratricopeptide (TPR) repeat protein
VIFVHFLYTTKPTTLFYSGKLSVASLFFMRGNYYFEGSGPYNLEAAKRNYYRALWFDSRTDVPVRYQLGRVYFIKGQLDQALDMFNSQIELDKDFPKSYYMRGLTHGYMHRLEAAAQDFETYLELVPDSWAAHNDIAWVYFRAGSLERAEEHARLGLAIAPDNPWLLNALGGILINQNQHAEARQYLVDARANFEAIGLQGWASAYPGNDPAVYSRGYNETLESIDHNLSLIKPALHAK